MDKGTNLRNRLTDKLSINDIYEICYLAHGHENDSRKEELYRLTCDADDRVASNALWAFTHFDAVDNEWLYTKQDDLIDRVLVEKNTTRCRLMLNLLLHQPFEEENLRTDFLDFCIAKITACAQPYAIRALCMKLAYEQCKFYPELLGELKVALDMLSQEPLSPGLASAKRQVIKKIGRSVKGM